MARRYIKKTCPKCGGAGVITHINWDRQKTTGPSGTGFATTCDKCGGKGYVKTNLFVED